MCKIARCGPETLCCAALALVALAGCYLLNGAADTFSQSYGVAVERSGPVTNSSNPLLVAGSCEVLSGDGGAASVKQYLECKSMNDPSEFDPNLSVCGVVGGSCTQWAHVDCQPCYYTCTAVVDADHSSWTCGGYLAGDRCYTVWSTEHEIEYQCAREPDRWARAACLMHCSPDDWSCSCTDVCMATEPDRLCSVHDATEYHLARQTYYVVGGRAFVARNLTAVCTSDQPDCASAFAAPGQEMRVYYRRADPSDAAVGSPPTNVYRGCFWAVLVLAAASLAGTLTLLLRQAHSDRHAYESIA